MSDPDKTIMSFYADPNAFLYGKGGEYHAILTEKQNERLMIYLSKNENYFLDNFDKNEASHLLALSYGENSDVNMQLAMIVQEKYKNTPSIDIAVQWEIANIIYERNEIPRDKFKRIDLDYDKDYITSAEVVMKFKHFIITSNVQYPKIFLVCQAWHAPRCKKICEEAGLIVVGGKFINDFSKSDKQKWVRNWLAWVLKEGTRKK
ncbi:hypothetical protein KKB18_10895 [bacterium]|nr:hypothetical protein [bacterium]